MDVNLVGKIFNHTHWFAQEGGKRMELHYTAVLNGAFQQIVPPYEAMDLDKKPHCSQFNHCNCNYIIIVEVENDPAQKSIIYHITAYNIKMTFH